MTHSRRGRGHIRGLYREYFIAQIFCSILRKRAKSFSNVVADNYLNNKLLRTYLLFVVVEFYLKNLEERSVCLGREWCFPLGMFLHKST